MAEIPLAAMKAVAERLDGLGLDYAFLGGSVVGLLLDYPDLSPVRATDDVDVVIEVVSRARYSDVEAKLRALKFDHDSVLARRVAAGFSAISPSTSCPSKGNFSA